MKNYAACIGADWGQEVGRIMDGPGLLTILPTPEMLQGGPADRPAAHVLRSLCDPTPRYVFFLNWSWMVPPEVTEEFECVNFHATPLPYGRGGGPIEGMILRGHTETVMTAHRMTQELDAGPIYARHAMPISLAGTKEDILARFVEPVTGMVRWIIDNEPEPFQQLGDVVEFKRLPKAEYEALWEGRK